MYNRLVSIIITLSLFISAILHVLRLSSYASMCYIYIAFLKCIYIYIYRERERERERERQTDRQPETERDKDRETETETHAATSYPSDSSLEIAFISRIADNITH